MSEYDDQIASISTLLASITDVGRQVIATIGPLMGEVASGFQLPEPSGLSAHGEWDNHAYSDISTPGAEHEGLETHLNGVHQHRLTNLMGSTYEMLEALHAADHIIKWWPADG